VTKAEHPPLPEEVRQLLENDVRSYEDLAVLALLHRSAGARATIEDIAREVHLSADVAESAVERLLERGLVVRADGAAAAQEDAARAAAIGALLRAYEEQPLDVLEVLNASAIDRVRELARRTFGADPRSHRKDE
jgi:predicted DNA-binding transcriptional regulator